MAIRYNQYKADGTAIGAIITWAGNTIPNGYLACDGTTYTISGVANQGLRNLASMISGEYDAADTYPAGSTTGTGTFTVPDMNVDDVVVGRGTQTLGSRDGVISSTFGDTKLNADQWPSHKHTLPRQNFLMTNSVSVTTQPNHYGGTTNNPTCPSGNACMSYAVQEPGNPGWWGGTNPPTTVYYACINFGGWIWAPAEYGPCNRPGFNSYGPRGAASGAAMGPESFFSYTMQNSGTDAATVASHTHSANTVQPSMRMQFVIKAF
jgi:microcystin-dependent protein